VHLLLVVSERVGFDVPFDTQ